jgi:hypothetical protein
MTDSEISKLIHNVDHPQIKDWPKRPNKTIVIVFLLLFSGLLFVYMGITKYLSDHTYDIYLPYTLLGILLLFPGVYYTVIFICILIGKEDYDYSDLPDLDENS